MVTEITAFTAEDGSVHRTKLEAVKQDALLTLKKLDMFNHASALAIIDAAERVVEALQPVIDCTPVAVEAPNASDD